MQQSILNGDYAFLEYAAGNWLSHLKDLDSDRGRLSLEEYSSIRRKTMVVLDFHQLSSAQDYNPIADIARYFLAFVDCPEIHLHPVLRDEAHHHRVSSQGSSLNPFVTQTSQLLTPGM